MSESCSNYYRNPTMEIAAASLPRPVHGLADVIVVEKKSKKN